MKRISKILATAGVSISMLVTGVGSAFAATTIGANVTTDGNLSAYGNIVLKDAVAAADTIDIGDTSDTVTVLGDISLTDTQWSVTSAGNASFAQLIVGSVDNTEISYLNGVTSAIQTQLDGKQSLDSDLTDIAALVTTAYGRGMLVLADAAAGRTALGLVIGTNVQAWDTDLDSWSAIAPSAKAASGANGDITSLTAVTSIDTITVSATALTFAFAGSIKSQGANTMTVDSGGTGLLEIGTSAHAKTITIGADDNDTFSLSSTGLKVSTTGAITGASGNISQWTNNSGYLLPAAIGVSIQAYDADLDAWALLAPANYSTTAQIAAAYQPLDSDLTSIAALTTTAYGRGMLALADAAAGQTALGLVIGTNVQAYDADLTDWAGVNPSAYTNTAGLGALAFLSSVASAQITDGSVSGTDILDATVVLGTDTSGAYDSTADTIADDGTIVSAEITDGTIANVDLASGSFASITGVGTLGSLAVNGALTLGPATSHVVSSQTTIPGVTASAGTPSILTGSTDTAGQVSSDATAHTTVTVTFNTAYANAPICVISPANAAAAVTAGNATGAYVTTTTTTMVINIASEASAQAWNYVCVGN
ncbi:MAG: hypothetical protein WCT10_04890 [Patescibacteria group bacterium]